MMLSRLLKRLARAVQDGNDEERKDLGTKIAEQIRNDGAPATSRSEHTSASNDSAHTAFIRLKQHGSDEYQTLLNTVEGELRKMSTGNSIERLRAGKKMLAWLEIVPPEATEWFAAFYPVARRLFLDKTTAVWRNGAYCMGRMFHYRRAKELLVANLFPKPDAAPSSTDAPEIHIRRRAFAALGSIALYDADFACWQIKALFEPLPGETRNAFNRRRSGSLEEWLVFALPDLRRTKPECARAVFNQLAEKTVQKNSQIHFNLAFVAEELFAEDWREDIRGWYVQLTSDLNGTNEPELVRRYPLEKIRLNTGYKAIADMLYPPSPQPQEPITPEDLYSKIDCFDRLLESNISAIKDHQGSVLERHNRFIQVTDTIYAFFEPGRHALMLPNVNPPVATRWNQLAENARQQLEGLLESELKFLHDSRKQRRQEAFHYFSNGLHLLTTVIAAFPDCNTRIAAYEKIMFDIRIRQINKREIGRNNGDYETAAERLFDDIWNKVAPDCRCAEIQKMAYRLQRTPNGKELLEGMRRIVREPELKVCLEKACGPSQPGAAHQECRHNCSFWNSFLLPRISRLNRVLTSTANDNNFLTGLLQTTANELRFPFDPGQARQYLATELIMRTDPRHVLRGEWQNISEQERIQTCAYLLTFFQQAFQGVLESCCPVNNLPEALQDVSASAGNFAAALLTPVGRHRPLGSPLDTYINTTILGVLQAPEGGTDQFTRLTLLRRFGDSCHANQQGLLPWSDEQRPTEPDSTWLHVYIEGPRWNLSFPWYLITGLIQALCEDERWQGYQSVQIERSCRNNKHQIIIRPLETQGLPWRLNHDNPLVTRDAPPDSGGHKVGFWLYWLNRMLTFTEEQDQTCWKIEQPADNSISASLCIRFTAPDFYP